MTSGESAPPRLNFKKHRNNGQENVFGARDGDRRAQNEPGTSDWL